MLGFSRIAERLGADFGLAAVVVAFSLSSSCRSEIKATIRQSKMPAAVSEIAGAVSGTRTFYQTRSVITLKLNQDDLPAGASFSLINDTNGVPLVESQTATIPLLQPDYSVLAADDSGYDLILKLYPSTDAMRGRLVYGDNLLKLVVTDESGDRFSTTGLQLRDFTISSLQLVGPPPAASAGLELWMNNSSRPVATSSTTLTTGTLNIVND